jgi:heme/copper-type cytochrome/quinol oxidase subunit 2
MKRILAIIIACVSPMMALAQVIYKGDVKTDPALGVGGLFDLSESFLNRAVVLIVSIAVVYFIWSVFRFMTTEDESTKNTAKKNMVWGIVAIFVMISIWGLVAILQSTFGIFATKANNTDLKNMIPRF